MAAGERRQLPALTGVRFLLALWVVVYHQSPSLIAAIGDSSSGQRGLAAILQTGYAAVGFFFVLSGFVLAYNYDLTALSTKPNAIRYGIARISRIYPAYLMGLLLLIPLAVYRMVAHISNEGYGISNFFLNALLLQSWVPSAALTWNFPGWSLSNEAFFYAALPLVGGWILRLGGRPAEISEARKLLFWAAALWALALLMPLFAVLHPIPGFGDAPATDMRLAGAGLWANFIRYNPLFRLPEFCIGVLLARLYRLVPQEASLHKRGAWFYLPGIAITLAVLINADRIRYPFLHNGLLVPAFALVIFGLALGGGLLAKMLSQPALVFLGNASYSMYILHFPIAVWMSISSVRLFQLVPDGVGWFTCYVSACVVVSALFFRMLEEPAHRWMKGRLNAWAIQRLGVASSARKRSV